MTKGFYETNKALSEYLLFHYGKPDEVLPWEFGPTAALDYPVRCVTECVDTGRIPANARGLDLGCAVGRSTFELARHCTEVIGIDLSESFITAAGQLQHGGRLDYSFAVEGELGQAAIAEVPTELDRTRVRFEQGDATFLRDGLGQFDIVLMAKPSLLSLEACNPGHGHEWDVIASRELQGVARPRPEPQLSQASPDHDQTQQRQSAQQTPSDHLHYSKESLGTLFHRGHQRK